MNTRPNPQIYLAGQIHFIGFGPNPNLYSLSYPDNGLGPNPNLYPIKLSKIGANTFDWIWPKSKFYYLNYYLNKVS